MAVVLVRFSAHLVILGLLLVVPAVLHAQDPDALYREGVAAFERGDVEASARAFDALIAVRAIVMRTATPESSRARETKRSGLTSHLLSWLRGSLPAEERPVVPYLEVAARLAEWSDRRDAFKPGHAERVTSFCAMIAECASRYGAENIGIGTDLCQDQPDSVVEWMRVRRWSKQMDYGEGSADNPGFPPMPSWFEDNRHFDSIEDGLRDVGMSEPEIAGVMGGNWYRFFAKNFVALSAA